MPKSRDEPNKGLLLALNIAVVIAFVFCPVAWYLAVVNGTPRRAVAPQVFGSPAPSNPSDTFNDVADDINDARHYLRDNSGYWEEAEDGPDMDVDSIQFESGGGELTTYLEEVISKEVSTDD